MAVFSGPEIVNNGLVLHLDAANPRSYPGSGTTWFDLSSNGNDGILVNGTAFNNQNNGRFSIDASDDYINISTGFTGSTWSLMLWHLNIGPIEFTKVGHRTFVSSNTFRFQWDDTESTTIARGPFIDFTSAAGGGQASYSTIMTPSDIFNKWHLVGVVASSSSVKTFYNTNTLNQSSIIGAPRQFSTNGVINIGVDTLSGIGGIDRLNRDGGTVYISNFIVYNRSLTDVEIQQNFEATRGRYGI
jgi:hypothetical protein